MEEGKTLGVWSTQSKSWIGSGTTRRKTIAKRFWHVVELPDGTYHCTPLTSNMVASGSGKIVQHADFHNDYAHEPEFVTSFGKSTNISGAFASRAQGNESASPSASTVSDSTDQATSDSFATFRGASLGAKKLSPREMEEKEHETRADFGMGLTYLKMGKTEQAKEVFDAIPDQDIPWQAEHKHMFSDFGTGLRKSRLHEIALKHYLKALELSPADEHLCHNIARVYYEMQQMDDCREWLVRSLELNPDLVPSQQFLRFLDKQVASGKK